MLTITKCGAGRLLLLLSLFLFAQVACAKAEYRALWVDIFHDGLRSKAEADTMMKTARDAGYNTIIIQVRKACDACYTSTFEPRSLAIEAGFDPLAYILEQAHRAPRMDVYAWLVTYRARISGDSGWENPEHVFQQHPEWMSEKRDGGKVAPGSKYYLDPGVPQVIDYNLMTVRDILSRYDVDGIMFDYLRYPDSDGRGNEWGYNDIAIARFNKLYGRTGKPAADDPQFSEFRRRQISDLTRKIYAHVRLWRPRVKIGAATITWGALNNNFLQSSAYSNIMQDWETMAMEGWLDLIMPMNYKRESIPAQAKDHRDWAGFLADLSERSGRAGVNIVDGERLNSISGILAQISATRNLPGMDGISTYAYSQPHAQSGKIPDMNFFNTIRSKVFPEWADVPEATWLTRPTEALIKGVISQNGKPVDGATVRLGNRTTHTDGTGFYAFARVQPGNHQINSENSEGSIGTITVTVQAGLVAEAPIGSK